MESLRNMGHTILEQRKFSLALLFSVSSVVALFTGYIAGGEFIALATLILGIYGAANVAQRKVEK